jgi:transposase-like protein
MSSHDHKEEGRGPYPEFRREAVVLYRSSGKSLKVIAIGLGVSVESLWAWAKEHEVDAGVREGLRSAERGEQRTGRQDPPLGLAG